MVVSRFYSGFLLVKKEEEATRRAVWSDMSVICVRC